jgi:peptide methionine sulfoxide reductase msrA/msrB
MNPSSTATASPRFARRIARVLAVTCAALLLAGCAAAPTAQSPAATQDAVPRKAERTGDGPMATIYLAGGCFWGLEKYMDSAQGVLDAESGYANGHVENPTYEQVCSGTTGSAETVKVEYDPAVTSLEFLLELYYKAIDPTSVNRQGNDVGSQYRSGIYYADPADLPVIERSLAKLQESTSKPIAVKAEKLTQYARAEEYHQDYLDKHPGGYCHIPKSLFKDAAEAVPPSPED